MKPYVTTKELRDSYGYIIPAGVLVNWSPGSPARGILPPQPYTYGSWKDETLFREATQAELDLVTTTINSIPVHKLFGVRGGGSIGSDPEVFVVDKDGMVIPAWKFLPPPSPKGTSQYSREHIYWDGFQAEFDTPAGGCLASWIDDWQGKLKDLQAKAHKYDPTSRLSADCVMPIPAEILHSAALEHTQLGCMPSKNIYGDTGKSVSSGRELPIRFAGCHLHHGFVNVNEFKGKYLEDIIQTVDAVVGVISVSVLEGLEDPARREYYGLAGEYRLPQWGLEYRTLSSAILWHPMLVHFHSNLFRFAVAMSTNNYSYLWKTSPEEVRHTINTLDIGMAREIISRNRKVLEDALWGIYHDPTQAYASGMRPPTEDLVSPARMIDEFILQGVRKFIKLDIDLNWHLSDGQWLPHSEGPQVMVWRAMRDWLGRDKVTV